MLKKIKIFAITLTFFGFTYAEKLYTTNAFDFETMDLDARSVSLGGASSLLPSGATSHWGNPALIAANGKNSFGAAFLPLGLEITAGGITGTIKLNQSFYLAPTFKYLSVGEIEGLDKTGEPLTNSVYPFSFDGGVALGNQWLQNFSSGISLRYIYEFLSPALETISSETKGSALLADGGIYFQPTRNIALSAGFKNAGVVLSEYEGTKSDLPVSVYSGIRYFTKGISQSSLILECEKEQNFPLAFRPAIELQFLKELISLRLGTSVSTDDIRRFANIIVGDSKESHTYSKTESQRLSIGAGLAVPIQDKTVAFDFATRFIGDGMGINFAFSGGFIF